MTWTELMFAKKRNSKALLKMKLTHSASEESSSNSLIIGRTTFEACETASFFVLVNLDSLIPIKKTA